MHLFRLLLLLPVFLWSTPTLFYWQPEGLTNFGDYLSIKVVERMASHPFKVTPSQKTPHKLLAIGSILHYANEGDIVWGSGINGKRTKPKYYKFKNLDVRAVRGPLTKEFLQKHFKISSPEIYGDPALLVPYLFPEFKRAENPIHDYIVIPHFRESKLYKDLGIKNLVHPTEPWDVVIQKILNSRFVISSSLHGIIVAEAYGIPAQYIRLTETESLLKYKDYYSGTGRSTFRIATSIEEALKLGGEPPFQCDLQKLYNAFPKEW